MRRIKDKILKALDIKGFLLLKYYYKHLNLNMMSFINLKLIIDDLCMI